MLPSDAPPRSARQALVLWLLYVLIFFLFGGLGAGMVALVFTYGLEQPFSDPLYAVAFGATGFMAYRLAEHLTQHRSR